MKMENVFYENSVERLILFFLFSLLDFYRWKNNMEIYLIKIKITKILNIFTRMIFNIKEHLNKF